MDAGRFKQLTRPGAVQRLLVRATNWLGDAVMMAPALAALRQRFPDARISLLAKPAVGELFTRLNNSDGHSASPSDSQQSRRSMVRANRRATRSRFAIDR